MMITGGRQGLAVLLLGMAFPLFSRAQPAATSTAPSPRNLVETIITGDAAQQATRLDSVLTDSSADRVAILNALLPHADHLATVPAIGLQACLSAEDRELRTAAIRLAAALRSPRLNQVLGEIAQAPELPLRARLAALEALTLRASPDALRTLARLLDLPDPTVRRAALENLELVTAINFGNSFLRARRWAAAELSDLTPDWEEQRTQRLVAARKQDQREFQTLAQRLQKAYRENYFRAPEAQRPKLLAQYLGDELPPILLLGLNLVQGQLAEGKQVDRNARHRVEALLVHEAPAVRAAATRTLAQFRSTEDADRIARRFTERLIQETDRDVRLALLTGLGYVGSSAAVEPLINLIRGEPERRVLIEAITALGRLAERNQLLPQQRNLVAQFLRNRLDATLRADAEQRERLLWASSRVDPTAMLDVFLENAADAEQAELVREAALRSIPIAQLRSDSRVATVREVCARLVPLLPDASPGFRRRILETLEPIATQLPDLEPIWTQFLASSESAVATRTAAWRLLKAALRDRSADAALNALTRLPEADPAFAPYRRDLLEFALEKLPAAAPGAVRGHLHGKLARLLAGLQQHEGALVHFRQAALALHAADDESWQDAAFALIRHALLHNAYDARLANELAQLQPPLNKQHLWDRLTVNSATSRPSQSIEAADPATRLAAWTALRENPPVPWEDKVLAELNQRITTAAADLAATRQAEFDAAVRRLVENRADAAARDRILALGESAAPLLIEALRETLAAEPINKARESALVELLQTLRPGWTDYDLEMSVPEKKAALDRLENG